MTKLPEFAPEFLSCAYEREIQVPFSLIIIKGKLVVIDKEEHLPFHPRFDDISPRHSHVSSLI